MRVLYISSESINKHGGTALRIREITSQWINQGHQVLIIAPQYEAPPPLSWSAAVRLIRFPFRHVIFYLLYELYSLVLVPKKVIQNRYNVVISTGGLLSWPLSKILRLLNTPFIVELNGIADIEATRMHDSWLVAKLHGWIVRFSGLYKSADLYICVATGIRDELICRNPSAAKNSVVIGNGIDPTRFIIRDKSECRRIMGIDPGEFVFGFVGLLCPWHGTEDLLAATSILRRRGIRNFKILIIGLGERYSVLRAQVARDDLEDMVRFVGRVPTEVIPIYLGCLDVACQVHNDPVVGRLGDSMKFWEYLAAGLPVIVSDMSGSCLHVRPGIIGWTYRGGDSTALADRMQYIMKNPEELSRFAVVNRSYVLHGHRWEDIASNMMGAIEKTQQRYRA